MLAGLRAAGALTLVVWAAACGVETADETRVPSGGEFGQTILSERRAACEAEGGQWGSSGAGFVCFTRMPDAGERCAIGTDCAGVCLARSRTCAPVSPFVGCHDVITDSGLRAEVCTG